MTLRPAWWRIHDWWLTAAMLCLMAIGLVMLSSSSLSQTNNLLTNQVLFVCLGLIIYFSISIFKPAYYYKAAPYAYAVCLLLLVALAIYGQATRGAVSWFDFGAFSLQPSEFMKIAIVLTMAFAYDYQQKHSWPTWSLLPLYGLIGLIPIGLVLAQPDFGTAAIMMIGWFAVVWLSPINKKVLAAMLISISLCAIVGWSALAPYQQQRVMTFLNPAADPLGSGYNVLQSVIAVQSGGLLGQGWGQGTQSHLNFLPEHQTDFIFASLAEEFGLVGSLVVILLYAIIMWRGLRLVWHNQSQKAVIVLIGLTLMLLCQAMINIAMNIGLAPVTGIPLPLVSYGGSSLLASTISLAIIQGLARQQAYKEHQ